MQEQSCYNNHYLRLVTKCGIIKAIPDLSNKVDHSLLAVRNINHKYIVAGKEKEPGAVLCEYMDLQLIRQDIDKIDKEITRLFEERMKLTYEVAAFKIENGKKVYDKEREDSKLETLSGLTEDSFNQQAIRELFSQIMSISRRKQYTLVKHDEKECQGLSPMECLPEGEKKVACFGEPGSYTEQAMEEFFGGDARGVYKNTFKGVMDALKSGEVEYGVLPIENSSTGSITDIYDLLIGSEAYIIGEHEVKVEQALIGLPGTPLEDITRVYSHEQGIKQCASFLEQHPNMKTYVYDSTSAGVKKVAEDKEPCQAAIGSRRAAEYYNLQVLQADINERSNNCTRFIVITQKPVYAKYGKKMSICFGVKHESGTLYNMLANFMFNHLNLTRIESRPIENRKWEYHFFVEFEGNIEEAGVQNALRGIMQEASDFYLFGCF